MSTCEQHQASLVPAKLVVGNEESGSSLLLVWQLELNKRRRQKPGKKRPGVTPAVKNQSANRMRGAFEKREIQDKATYTLCNPFTL